MPKSSAFRPSGDLRRMLRAIDRKGYPAYKQLAGPYRFDRFDLHIDHVQGDPFAAPSSVRIEVAHGVAGFPAALRTTACQRRALADHLTRLVGAQFARAERGRGSGKSGLVAISRCGQEVLERSACEIGDDAIILRFHVGFPAFGRTIDAEGLDRILFGLLPRVVDACLVFRNIDNAKATRAVLLAEDQHALRAALRREGLVAFVADGAVLPRESGVSDKPMRGAVPFASPETLRKTFELPHTGAVSGMALEKGVTLIVGGGYHGKSTLLEALQAGVYDHIAGDGREFVVADATAVKLRAEDGRSVRDVDISAFINGLPNGADTASFSSLDASGSTSQAAAVAESLEAGARLFLIDEDTSATNFMVRDELMQRVVSREQEPITPFVERVRALCDQAGASTILVAGSSGAFFSVADCVVQMDCYRPFDVTERVREICAAAGAAVPVSAAGAAGAPPAPTSAAGAAAPALPDDGAALFAPRRSRAFPKPPREAGERDRNGRRDGAGRGRRGGGRGAGRSLKVRSHGRDSLSVGTHEVDVRLVEQIADDEQTAALAYLLRYALERLADGRRTVPEIADALCATLDDEGWAPLCGGYVPCGLAKPRREELIACLNRYRG